MIRKWIIPTILIITIMLCSITLFAILDIHYFNINPFNEDYDNIQKRSTDDVILQTIQFSIFILGLSGLLLLHWKLPE